MPIIYQDFTPLHVDQYFDSYGKTISNLVPIGEQTAQDMKNNLQTMIDQDITVLIAIDTDVDEIVGSITVLIEQKLTRGGSKAAHIEELVTRKGREGKGIGSTLVKQAIAYATEKRCYKIILDCSPELVSWYSTFGFEQKEVSMKMYC